MSTTLKDKLKEAFEKFPYETHQLFLRNYIPLTLDPFSLSCSEVFESYNVSFAESEIKLNEDMFDKNAFLNLYFSQAAKKFVLSGDSRFERVFGSGGGFLSKIVEVEKDSTLYDSLSLHSADLASEVVVFIVKKGVKFNHLKKVEGTGNFLYNAYYFLEDEASVSVNSLISGKMYSRERIYSFNQGFMSSFNVKLGYDLDDASSTDSTVIMKLMASKSSANSYQKSVVRKYSKTIHKGLVINTAKGVEGNSYIEQKALLLSKDASVQNIPGMELEINDIYAKHSAAVFPVDEDQLFYLMSRGLSRENSIKLLAKNMLSDIREALGITNEQY
jgi:ABC-type transport system involved in Fe-S cluster assembly, permease component